MLKKRKSNQRRKKQIECVICEKMFTKGWNPKFDKEHGICQKCLKGFEDKLKLSDMTPEKREEELIGIFRDFE